MYDQLKTTFAAYRAGISQSFSLAEQGRRDELTKLLLIDMKTVVDGSGKQLNDLADLFAKQVAAESQKSEAHYEASRMIVSEALQTITESVHQIHERNLVIASAAEEQAQVAREVDRNLVNIRDLSVRSAAGADQTSASSHELSQLANSLRTMVQRFQV